MLRNMLRIFILTFCFFAVVFSTQSTDGVTAYADAYTWRMLTNDFTDFYDRHCAEVSMNSPQDYYGWYSGEAWVTGNGQRDDDQADAYYAHGAAGWATAVLLFPNLNEEVSGEGAGYCRIQGTPPGMWGLTTEDDDSYQTSL